MAQPLTATERHERFKAIAEKAGVPVKIVARAFKDREVNACAYLRICAAAGIDPVTGATGKPVREPNAFSFFLLGAATILARMDKGHTSREAAQEAGISLTTMSRIENAQVVSIDAVLKACRYIGADPFKFTAKAKPGEPLGVKRDAFHDKQVRKHIERAKETLARL